MKAATIPAWAALGQRVLDTDGQAWYVTARGGAGVGTDAIGVGRQRGQGSAAYIDLDVFLRDFRPAPLFEIESMPGTPIPLPDVHRFTTGLRAASLQIRAEATGSGVCPHCAADYEIQLKADNPIRSIYCPACGAKVVSNE